MAQERGSTAKNSHLNKSVKLLIKWENIMRTKHRETDKKDVKNVKMRPRYLRDMLQTPHRIV